MTFPLNLSWPDTLEFLAIKLKTLFPVFHLLAVKSAGSFSSISLLFVLETPLEFSAAITLCNFKFIKIFKRVDFNKNHLRFFTSISFVNFQPSKFRIQFSDLPFPNIIFLELLLAPKLFEF